ncbi:MAG: phosphatase PAP2 family protein [Spirochaetaceae bacterium]|jgi:membrane-associated phospholipid phosphatase|nr:phosphatase PAP2 family protein [Spirochaetaceae bacterium]
MKIIHWILVFVFTALMCAGTLNDFSISLALFQPDNKAALMLERLGELPGIALLVICSMGICGAIFSLNLHSSLRTALYTGLAAIPMAGGFYILFSRMLRDAGIGFFPALCTAILLAVFSYCIFIPANRLNPKKVITTCLTGVFCFIGSMLIIGALKTLWGRQRFFSMDDPIAQFTAWYLPQGKARGDEYKSFPSGHACAAAVLIWWTLLPDCFGKLKKWKPLVWLVFTVYLGITMWSRIALGRHFLSDVTAGAGITIAVFYVFKILVKKMWR